MCPYSEQRFSIFPSTLPFAMTPENNTKSRVECASSVLKETFHVKHSIAAESLKTEDVVFHESSSEYHFFALCDGHGGRNCAEYVKKHFWKILEAKLPVMLCNDLNNEDIESICERIRQSLVSAFKEIDEAWYTEGSHSGTTMTVALLLGRVLTIANVGDSDGYLHLGDNFFKLTQTHRLEDSASEHSRLKNAGVTLAPLNGDFSGPATNPANGFGPLRIWPGGLANARSIGNCDLTPQILCLPHLRQIVIPRTGGRVILASDGVWDYLASARVPKLLSRNKLDECSNVFVRLARLVQGAKLRDDTTAITVDLLPSGSEDFVDIMKRQKESIGTLERLKCQVINLAGCKVRDRSQKSIDYQNLILADVDGMMLVEENDRTRKTEISKDSISAVRTTDDITVHGGQRARGFFTITS